MKVFLDTNIFLDMIVIRDNHADNENAALLLKMASLDEFEFFISPITVSTCFYLSRKDPTAVGKIENRLKQMMILPMDERDVHFALQNDLPDKEDAMQMSCADRGGCDIIITRDTRHFACSPVPALSPAAFFAKLRA